MDKYCICGGENFKLAFLWLENSLKRCFTVLRSMCHKYFLSGKRNLCIIFIWLNVSGFINCSMQLNSFLLIGPFLKVNLWFQQKSLLNLPLFFCTQHYCDAVLKNQIWSSSIITVSLLSGLDPRFSNCGAWKVCNRGTSVVATYCSKTR